MANEIQMTVNGNLTADPELRYTQGGLPVVNFTVASTPRTFDKTKNEWVDGEATFLRCSAWRDYAEHIAATLTKGMRVIVTGRFKTRAYEDKEGNKRTSIELEVDEIGPSLRYATAVVTKSTGRTPQYTASQAAADEAWAGVTDEPWAAGPIGGDAGPSTWTQPTLDDDAPF